MGANEALEMVMTAIPEENHQHCVRKGSMGTKGQYEWSIIQGVLPRNGKKIGQRSLGKYKQSRSQETSDGVRASPQSCCGIWRGPFLASLVPNAFLFQMNLLYSGYIF